MPSTMPTSVAHAITSAKYPQIAEGTGAIVLIGCGESYCNDDGIFETRMFGPIFDLTNYAFTAYALPVGLVGTLIAGLGMAVLVRERGSPVSWAFASLTWSVALWLLGFALIYSTSVEPIARWWVKVEHLGVVFIPSTVYLFTLAIVRPLRPLQGLAWAGFALSILFYFSLLLSDQFITGVRLYAW